MKINILLLIVLFLIFLYSCSGIKVLDNQTIAPPVDHLYSENFLKQISAIKGEYGKGKTDIALLQLQKIDETQLLKTEIALKRNLMGVIYFSLKKYDEAVYNFGLALANSSQDYGLTAQVYLNLASSYYRAGFMDKAFDASKSINPDYLSENELQKYYLLHLKLCKHHSEEKLAIPTYIHKLKSKNSISELESDPSFFELKKSFLQLNGDEQSFILRQSEKYKSFVSSYLAYFAGEISFLSGDKSRGNNFFDWSVDNNNHKELASLIESFLVRIENLAKLNMSNVGIVLPLSGKKKTFGERALFGIDIGFKDLLSKNEKIKLFISDSESSETVGSQKVIELIEKHNVMAIIGGLFPEEAVKEYLEARSRGVLFISLSAIYLPKEQKDYLLVEIPSSIESQMELVFSKEFLNKFGKRAALIYQNGARGEAYAEAFWRMAEQTGVTLSGVASFNKEEKNYSFPVKHILGLDFTKDRHQEVVLHSQIAEHEKRFAHKRIQHLTAQQDFDWLFVPVFPFDALQVIPWLPYYDARNIEVIGDYSWRSQLLAKDGERLGTLYFIEGSGEVENSSFIDAFNAAYGINPGLVETVGKSSIGIIDFIVNKSKDEDFDKRDSFNVFIRGLNELTSSYSKWHLKENLWIKKSTLFSLRRSNITPVSLQ